MSLQLPEFEDKLMYKNQMQVYKSLSLRSSFYSLCMAITTTTPTPAINTTTPTTASHQLHKATCINDINLALNTQIVFENVLFVENKGSY